MFALLGSLLSAVLSFFLPRIFRPKPAAQAAVDAERQMAQDAVDRPSEGQAIKELENGKI